MPPPSDPHDLGVTSAYEPGADSTDVRNTPTVDHEPPPGGDQPGAPAAGPVLGGRYTLLRAEGRGGMGQVWRAHDNVLGREVALKELLAGRADLEAQRRRLLHEAQITGQLQHPGIVPVYDVVGDPAAGRLFYTMRFVEGRTLRDAVIAFHARRAQSNMDRLELLALLNAFTTVCDTIAYAHARGVLHRDLKGENVILGAFGEVVVLDWGLAKARAAEEPHGPEVALGGEQEQTVVGQVRGTPGYMAPEQAAGAPERIGAHSDVYSLGAMLYLILTGQAPFTGTDVADVLRRVREQAPPRPCQLWPGVPAALQAICLHALAREPGQRYPSATALAAEVRRWLADEPVAAYRAPLRERLGRWVRRHRVLVAGAAVLLLTAVAALAAGVVLLGREQQRTAREAASALRAEAAANQAADEAARKQKLAEEQSELAKATLGVGMKALDEAFTQLSENVLLNRSGMQPERKRLLESALRHYQEFLARWSNEPAVRVEAALAWYRAGRITDEIGSPAEAVKLYDRAVALQEALVKEQPDMVRHQAALAETCYWRGISERILHQYDRARADHQRALALQRALVESRPPRVTDPRQLARLRHALGVTLDGLTHLNLETNNPAGAGQSLQQGVQVLTALIGQYPQAHEYRWTLAHLCGEGATLFRALRKYPQAIELHRNALGLLEAMPEAERQRLIVRQYQGNSLNGLGLLLELTGRRKEAESHYRKAAEVRSRLVKENPAVPTYRGEWGTSLVNLGGVLARQGKYAEALPFLEQACAPLEQLLASAGKNDNARATLGGAYRTLAAVQREQGDTAAAVRALGKYRKLWPGNGPRLYDAGCEYAQCAVRDPTAAPLALEALRAAVKHGFGDASRLRKEPRLRPLHDHPDFQRLLRELEGKTTRSG